MDHILCETVDFQKLAEEIVTQDNRGTQFPLFVVCIKRKVLTRDGHEDDFILTDEEGQEMDEESLCDDCVGEDELRTPCVTCGFYQRLPVKEQEEFDLRSGVFLTAAACDWHINVNKHHYEGLSAHSYAVSAWRNEEIQAVIQLIITSAGKEIPNWYK